MGRHPRGRVLLVDDDEGILLLLRTALEDEGYAVSTARDGEDGLAAAIREAPDIILLDLIMPNVSGWAFLELYRHAPGTHAPVVVVSAIKSGSLDMRRLNGAAAVLPKPLSLDHVLATVERCLGAPAERALASEGRAA